MLFNLGKYRYYLSNQQILDLNKTFNQFTSNRYMATPNILISLLKSEGIYYDQRQLQTISLSLFKQHKKIKYNVYEFIAIVGRYYVDEETENQFMKIFCFIDKKKKMKIDSLDLKHALIELGENIKDKEIDQIFLEMDLDQDGAIDFQEFMAAMIAV